MSLPPANLAVAEADLNDPASAEPEDFSGRDLSDQDFSGRDLRGCKFVAAQLRGASFNSARLDGCEFMGANLVEADFTNAQAHRCGFGRADLTRACLFGADCEGATFTHATLEEADLRASRLCAARLREARLGRAQLDRCVLTDADLSGAVVAGAVFSNCDLAGTRMRGLVAYAQADWIGARIHHADFHGAYILRRFIMDENYLSEFRQQGRVARLLYWLWWATSDCGRSFVRWGLWTLLISFGFAGLYHFVDVDYGATRSWVSPFYFSIVTLTTLGYGDVTPTSPSAQLVTMVEVVVGYVMLGGLLSIFANKMGRRAG